MTDYICAWRYGAALCCVLAPAVAHAELGGPVDSIAKEATQMKAARRMAQTSAGAYTTHAMTTPAGVDVVEYVDQSGTVFAVTWRGPVRPDLKLLLGPHFPALQEAAQGQGRRPVELKRPDLVIQTGGHMRDLRGRAYLPDRLPAGLSADSIH